MAIRRKKPQSLNLSMSSTTFTKRNKLKQSFLPSSRIKVYNHPQPCSLIFIALNLKNNSISFLWYWKKHGVNALPTYLNDNKSLQNVCEKTYNILSLWYCILVHTIIFNLFPLSKYINRFMCINYYMIQICLETKILFLK